MTPTAEAGLSRWKNGSSTQENATVLPPAGISLVGIGSPILPLINAFQREGLDDVVGLVIIQCKVVGNERVCSVLFDLGPGGGRRVTSTHAAQGDRQGDARNDNPGWLRFWKECVHGHHECR